MDNAHILIVDDNPEIREIIQILLSGEGFLTEEAKDGKTALDLLQTTCFDLIILDIMMPGLNGYQTCLEIRKITNAPNSISERQNKGQRQDTWIFKRR